MPLTGFFISLALLLAVPGPTNTLLALAGSKRQLGRSLPLAFLVLAGYLATILPIVSFAAPLLEARPDLALAVKLAASLWVLWLAVRLWLVRPADRGMSGVSAMALFTTTLLNPKGLVIGLALMPPVTAQMGYLLPLAVLSATVLTISVLWLALGATVIARLSRRHPVLVARAASSCLLVFGAGLAAKAVGLM